MAKPPEIPFQRRPVPEPAVHPKRDPVARLKWCEDEIARLKNRFGEQGDGFLSGGAAIGNSGQFWDVAWSNDPDYIDLVDADHAIVSTRGGRPVPPRSSNPAGRVWLSDVMYDTAGFVGPAGPGKFVVPVGWSGIYLMVGLLSFGLGNSVIMHDAQLSMHNGARDFAWGDKAPGVGGVDSADIEQGDMQIDCIGTAELAEGEEVWCDFGLRLTNMAATTPDTAITYVTSGRDLPYFSLTRIADA